VSPATFLAITIMSNIDTIKTLIDIIVGFATFLAITIGGIAAYGILLMSSKPRIFIDNIVLWPKKRIEGLENDNILSIQFRIINPAIGSQVVSELNIDSIELQQVAIEQEKKIWHMKAYAFMEELTIAVNKEDPGLKGSLKEPIHTIIMAGQGEVVKNVAFFPENIFDFEIGEISLKFYINYRIYNPLFWFLGTPKVQLHNENYCKFKISKEEMEDIGSYVSIWLTPTLEHEQN
jgi:hypothetical protein